jgi:hypothetical protein
MHAKRRLARPQDDKVVVEQFFATLTARRLTTFQCEVAPLEGLGGA